MHGTGAPFSTGCPSCSYIGVRTTRLHEHDIPHILLLKKAELHCGHIVPIFFSNRKKIVLWCKWDGSSSSSSAAALGRTDSRSSQRDAADLEQFVKAKYCL